MPRTAAAASINPTGTAPRLRPPDDLAAGSPEREMFVRLVLSLPANHFQEADGVLLSAFCRAACLEQTASSELAAAGYVGGDGKPSAWLPVLAQATRAMTVLSRLLRLNPLARRLSAESDDGGSSYYAKMRLEARHDLEPN